MSLGVTGTSITHLGLRALREISDGDVVIASNPNLCYNSPDHWKLLFQTEKQTVRPLQKGNSTFCCTDFTSYWVVFSTKIDLLELIPSAAIFRTVLKLKSVIRFQNKMNQGLHENLGIIFRKLLCDFLYVIT